MLVGVTNRRTATLVLSLLIGSLAAFFAYMYVSSAQDRAFHGAAMVPALVISGDIEKGTTGDAALGRIKTENVPKKFRPVAALTDKNQIRGKIALTHLATGQVLIEGMFADPRTAQETAAKRVPAGQVAVTVQVDEVRGVANLITPGDRVNIMTTLPDGTQRTLFTNVDVLFIGTTAAPAAGSTEAVTNPGSSLITFAVPQLAAERIVYASRQGTGIYLTLPSPDNKPAVVPPVNNTNLFPPGATPYEG
jgi:pilus assembly protein CpaB